MLRLLRLGAVIALLLAVSWGQAPTSEPTADVVLYTDAELGEQVGAGVSISISIMLIGSISFMMGLFYLVNSEDDDIRRYAWKVISATISIFCAVLLFQAFNGLVEEYCIDGGMKLLQIEEESPPAKIWECVIDITQLLFWLCSMQLVLAITSGAISEQSEYLWQPENMEEVEIATKSWAVLCAHISGFAAINAWGSVQQNMLGYNPATAILIVPIGLCGLFSLYFWFNSLREGIALGDDGEMDEMEEAWDAETEEAENDVAGLSLSFLTAQVLRFWIGGDLPNEEGKEVHDAAYNHSPIDCKLLICAGFVSALCLMFVLQIRARYPENPEELAKDGELNKEEMEEAEVAFKTYEGLIRPLLILNVYFSCGMAWCFFYGTYWTVAATGWTDQDAMLQVIIAIVVSFIAFSVIWGFDKIEDAGILGSEADKAILAMIDALGILIGFSWEQAFDVAVDVISEDVDKYIPKTFARLIMSFALVSIVFPAWKAYILPQEIETGEEATGLGQRKKRFRDKLEKHQKAFLEGEVPEKQMDHAHLALKMVRRKHKGKSMKAVKDGEKNLKHMVLTARGLMDAPEDENALVESLLPDCLREPTKEGLEEEMEEEIEAGWSKMKTTIKKLFGMAPKEEKPSEAAP